MKHGDSESEKHNAKDPQGARAGYTCEECDGEGQLLLICSGCMGTGGSAIGVGGTFWRLCQKCKGRGVVMEECEDCAGTGRVEANEDDECEETTPQQRSRRGAARTYGRGAELHGQLAHESQVEG